MTDCNCWETSKVQGLCYYNCKLIAHLLRSSDGTNGHVGSLNLEQERFIGIEDPDTSGAWDHTAIPASDLLSWLLRAKRPSRAWIGAYRERWEQERKGGQRMSRDKARLTVDQLAERFRTASEALADLQTADPADVELARQQFLEDAGRRLTASGASNDQREAELADLKASSARIRRSLGED